MTARATTIAGDHVDRGLGYRLAVSLIFLGLLIASVFAQAADARSLLHLDKYAAIVMDADSNEVLYARNPDAARPPASITKIMTLMIAFEEIDAGRLNLDDRVYFSATAASQPPSKLGIGKGGWITVEQAIRLLTTKSANDVAVALAERIEGTEVAFAQRMTEKARSLGMNATSFYNASGLPHAGHITTARDLATLSSALIHQFPHYYAYFSAQSYTMDGQTFPNHNRLLGELVGLDGIKTGFTNAAGFTLAASAQRDGKRLIAIVLGAPSSAARNENITELINSGFEVLKQRRYGRNTTVASFMKEPEPSVVDLWSQPATAQGSALDEDAEPVFEPTASLKSVGVSQPQEPSRAYAFTPFSTSLMFQSYAWLR